VGRAVEVLKYQTEGDLKRLLRKQIHHLVREEQVDPEDIVILTPRAPHRSALRHMGMLGEFSLNDTPDGSGEIFWTNIYQFKGLESPVVILVEIGNRSRGWNERRRRPSRPVTGHSFAQKDVQMAILLATGCTHCQDPLDKCVASRALRAETTLPPQHRCPIISRDTVRWWCRLHGDRMGGVATAVNSERCSLPDNGYWDFSSIL